jgi:hypothetical protein
MEVEIETKPKLSKEKMREYNQKFFNKHKDTDIKCEVCYRTYKYYNKSKHMLSKGHNIAIKIRNEIA